MKVLIVGAGLSGLSTAIGLANKIEDAAITIVERRADFEARGATFGLAPNGQKALQEICPDVLEQLKEEGMLQSHGGYMLPWYKVRDALLAKVRSLPERITLHMGVSIDKVAEKEESIVATFQNSDMTIEADVLIGADGVHSYVRTDILRLPPAVPTGAHVWRGSLNISNIEGLQHFTEFGLGKNSQFGDKLILFYFNFQSKTPGFFAWVFSCQDPSGELGIVTGETTPLDLIRSYMESLESPDEDMVKRYQDAKLVLENSHSSLDLTWSTQMAVVDLARPVGEERDASLWSVMQLTRSVRQVAKVGVWRLRMQRC